MFSSKSLRAKKKKDSLLLLYSSAIRKIFFPHQRSGYGRFHNTVVTLCTIFLLAYKYQKNVKNMALWHKLKVFHQHPS